MITEQKTEPEAIQGIVLHCDGGSRPNPGYGGWGMHGYLFDNTVPKQSSGHTTHVPTAKGYVPKTDVNLHAVTNNGEKLEVTTHFYIDGFGSFSEPISNNVAEIVAATNGLDFAQQCAVKTVQLYTDSEYVCKGLDNWAEKWRKNNWVKYDGSIPANVPYWKELLAKRDVLTQRGVKVSVNWIRGHVGNLGNELADHLATVGVMHSIDKRVVNSIDTTPAKGYWKNDSERHPFIANRRMYFNTLEEFSVPGEYYLGEHGKDDDTAGKRIADGAYAVIKIKQPDPLLELIRSHQCSMANKTDSIVMVRLDHLFRAETYQEISRFGTMALVRPNPTRLDLHCLDTEPLTREFKPPKLAMRIVEAVSRLEDKLEEYLQEDPKLIRTDLTSTLYETEAKINKKDGTTVITMKLKSEYNVGFAALKIEANYMSPEGDVKAVPVTLTLGIDLPNRNALKKIDELLPKVTLITWLEAPNVFRYATVIEAGEDKGIWAGCYSNLRLVNGAKPLPS